jgi:hypothetical protein
MMPLVWQQSSHVFLHNGGKSGTHRKLVQEKGPVSLNLSRNLRKWVGSSNSPETWSRQSITPFGPKGAKLCLA